MSGPLDGWQDLFVNAIVPAAHREITEEADVIDNCGQGAGSSGCAQALHSIGGIVIAKSDEQLAEFDAVGIVEMLIGVEPEEPLPGGVADGFIACSGEVVAPGEVEDTSAELGSDAFGVIAGAGVQDDYLVHEVARRGEAAA